MKRLGLSILGSSLLLAAPAFAGSADYTAAMMARLAQAGSPAHVKQVLVQQRTANCQQNAKNFGLQGEDHARYVTSCVNHDDAARLASLHGRS